MGLLQCFSAEIPAHIVANNDFAIFSGTETSLDRLVYQNNVGWGSQKPTLITLNSGETYIYILAMGGDPSGYWHQAEDLSGTINGINLSTINSIQRSSDLSPHLSDYISSRDITGTVGDGTYNAILADVQSTFSMLSWATAIPSGGLEVPTNMGFGLGYAFGGGEAVLFKISLTELDIRDDTDNDKVIDSREIYDGTELTDPNSNKNLSKGLLIDLPFDGSSEDLSGYGYNASLQNSDIIENKINSEKSLRLKGTPDSWVDIEDSANIPLFSLTLSAWIYNNRSDNSDARFICGKGVNQMEIHIGYGSLPDPLSSIAFFPGNGSSLTTTQGTPIRRWYHLACVAGLGSDGGKIYIDGAEVDILKNGSDASTPIVLDSSPFRIGRRSNGDWNRFDGRISKFRVYNRVLSAEEIQQIYNEGKNISDIDSNYDEINDSVAVSLGYDPSINFSPFLNYLRTNPATGLFNSNHVQESRFSGRADVTNNPNIYNLYRTNQIHDLVLGGIMLNRNANNQLILNYQVLESEDLVNWSTNSLQYSVTNSPTNKMFLRVRALSQ